MEINFTLSEIALIKIFLEDDLEKETLSNTTKKTIINILEKLKQ